MRALRLLLSALLLSSLSTLAVIDSGMVLLMTGGKLEVKYLSTGESVVLDDGLATNGSFSPDGRKVAYNTEGGPINIVNIDGTGRVIAEAGINSRPTWCSDGYIYGRSLGGIARMREDGTNRESVYILQAGTTSPNGGTVNPSIGDPSFSLDGTKVVGTVGYSEGGYAMIAIDLTTDSQFTPVQPCQGAISSSGNLLSVSTAGGHHRYRIFPWDREYENYGADSGDTWEGCHLPDDNFLCPSGHALFSIRDYFWENTDLPTDVRVSSDAAPQWSNSEEYVMMFTPEGSGITDSVAGTWLVEIPEERTILIGAEAYTKVGPKGTHCIGYYAEEIRLSAVDFAVVPSVLAFTADNLPQLPAAKTVTLSSTTAMSSAPTISGQPVWLQVTPTLDGPNTVTIENALVGAALPAEGQYTATVSVLADGAGEAVTYDVTLNVGPPPPGPFTIHNPSGGETYYVGDTLVVRYTADTLQLLGTVLSISVNAGEDYAPMHSDDALPLGDNLEYEYVIPADLFGPTDDVFTECMIRVTDYPNGSDVFSQMFTIAKESSGTRRQSLAQATGTLKLQVAMGRGAHGSFLKLFAPASGVARLFGVNGRVLHTFQLTGSVQTIDLGCLPAGRYMLQAEYDGGLQELAGVQRSLGR